MAYSVVRTDKLMGTDVRSMLESVIYMGSGSTETAIENGNVVKVTDLVADNGVPVEYEIKVGVTPAANDTLDSIVLIAAPEVMYDERKKALDEFRTEAGGIARGYHLHSGDIFSVTADGLSEADPAVGQVIELQAGVVLKNVASATNGSTVIGKIIDKNVVGRYTYYAIQVA